MEFQFLMVDYLWYKNR